MQFDLTFDLFAWVLLILLALLFCQFWPGGQRALKALRNTGVPAGLKDDVRAVWHHAPLYRQLESLRASRGGRQAHGGERHTNLRTWIKRLARRTNCFSKTQRMHDLVIGLFINRYEFGRPI